MPPNSNQNQIMGRLGKEPILKFSPWMSAHRSRPFRRPATIIAHLAALPASTVSARREPHSEMYVNHRNAPFPDDHPEG